MGWHVRNCKTCNAAFRSFGKRYCSDTCSATRKPRQAWNKGMEGLPGSRPRDGIVKTCKQCGATFYTPKGYTERQFCSMECYATHRWGGSRKEERSCSICGTAYTVVQSSKQVTCSPVCARIAKGRAHAGDKSLLWRGGKMAPYVGIWGEQRIRVLERDGHICKLCGSTDRIQVHHIIPYRYSQSHDLENLVTLCRSCHSREELRVNRESRAGLDMRGRFSQNPE